MHVDEVLAQWTAPLWAQLGIDGMTALLVLLALYFTVKWAVKRGIQEAVREMNARDHESINPTK